MCRPERSRRPESPRRRPPRIYFFDASAGSVESTTIEAPRSAPPARTTVPRKPKPPPRLRASFRLAFVCWASCLVADFLAAASRLASDCFFLAICACCALEFFAAWTERARSAAGFCLATIAAAFLLAVAPALGLAFGAALATFFGLDEGLVDALTGLGAFADLAMRFRLASAAASTWGWTNAWLLVAVPAITAASAVAIDLLERAAGETRPGASPSSGIRVIAGESACRCATALHCGASAGLGATATKACAAKGSSATRRRVNGECAMSGSGGDCQWD